MSLCPNCGKRALHSKHPNCKWCKPCADGFRAKPKHNLTPSQIREVRRRLFKMPKAQICEEVGISWSSLGRWAQGEGIRVAYFNRWVANPKLVKEVCDYYGKSGKAKTIERFPGIKLRSIVERYKWFTPRQIGWTEDQLKELARMAGIISMKAQARYFNRPGARIGAIRSVWVKKFKQGGGQINGVHWNLAKNFVHPDCPRIHLKFWSRRHPNSIPKANWQRSLVLWQDVERFLQPETPKLVKASVETMVRFQKWLHGPNPKQRILKMIKERELR